MTHPLLKWPSTSQLKDVKSMADRCGHKCISYRAKVKLRGTNSSVYQTDGEVVAQSRKRVLSHEYDNAGF